MSKSTITSSQVKIIKSRVKKITIPVGTILYRTQSINCSLRAQKCSDTGKIGSYFSNNIYIPLGMILEYNKPMYLCKYVTTKKISFYVGKYSFRDLEPKHFFKSYKDWEKGKFILHIDPIKSYNHMAEGMLPIHDMFFKKIWRENFNEREYFITNPKVVKRLKSKDVDIISVKQAKAILKEKESSLEKKCIIS